MDAYGKEIFVFKVEENQLRLINRFGKGILQEPCDIEYSSLEGGFVVVLDRGLRSLLKFSLEGNFIGQSDPQKVPIFNPGGIAIGKGRHRYLPWKTVCTDEIYITENDFRRIVKVKGDFILNPRVEFYHIDSLQHPYYLGDIEADQFGGYFFVDVINGTLYQGFIDNIVGPILKNDGESFNNLRTISLIGDQLFASELITLRTEFHVL